LGLFVHFTGTKRNLDRADALAGSIADAYAQNRISCRYEDGLSIGVSRAVHAL
jgi:hypothetical protein